MAETPSQRQLMEQALAELRRLKLRVTELEDAPAAPIAIVGLGCRFPGAESPDAFWRLLREGGDAIREVPRERWDGASYHHADPDAPGTMYTLAGGFLDRVDAFDAAFFGITPREAAALDPQQRLLLEVAWEALEHAAIAPDRLFGTPGGVFVGISGFDFALRQAAELDEREIDAYFGTGNALSVSAGRLAYLLGLEGPAVAVDTSCSSSLTALHLACQSLRARECEIALAGGVSVMLAPEITLTTCRVRALSPRGRSAAFAEGADGYVRGEGCGVVVLKRLADARRDGDRVLAVVRGSAINHDGHTAGLTVPNGQAQQRLMRQALAHARLAPDAVSYVEAHGTGTPLGDPIEMGAIGAVYGGTRTEPLVIGAVKANIGHLEAAAGVAGLIKVVLALGHGEIPPQLHAGAPNPLIPWATLPVEVPRARRPWPAGARERVAGISAFGFSGTNVHVLVSEPPPAPRAETPASENRRRHVLVLSARGAEALDGLRERYDAYLAGAIDECFADICYTAAVGRRHFTHRLAVVARDAVEARARLASGGGVLRGEARGHSVTRAARPDASGASGIEDDVERLGAMSTPETLARLYVAGADPDWTAAYAGERRQRLALPTYPFRRQRHWPALAASRRPKAVALAEGARPGGDPMPAAPAVAESADVRTRVARAPEREARQAMVAHVTSAVAHVSGLAAADLDDPHAGFFDLGLNSLMVVEVRNRLEQTLGLALPPTITFDHPNVAELAEHLVRLVREAGAIPDEDGDVEAAIETELRELEKILEKPQ